ncbi:MAG TPA: RluA family pseudouridine synthase [Actinomycetota bacterium]|nr:RluA family pseudouridine synthase [Actinomycetota bacterium]
MTRIPVEEADQGLRLDALVARRGGMSRARAAELVELGLVTVDGSVQPKAYKVLPGQLVESGEAPEREPSGPLPDVPVVWEDAHLLVVDKPSGVVVHRAPGSREPTMVDALAASGRPLAPRAGDQRPGVVHRLDREVSGLLVVAKTDEVHETLVENLAARRVRREYLAGVAGVPEVDRGKIDAPVGRSPRHRTKMAVVASGKPSVTWFRVREAFAASALLEVRLETGRTHQIRAHLDSIGHPVLGDPAYGPDPRKAREVGLTRPFLHSFRLTLVHPRTRQEMSWESPLPAELESALIAMRRA